ncbi:MAG: hypothetical protein A2099_01730 [Planctomycetes bacterium GWF2_39_10]|nr:MAG: hypothetical protein A2099_01730 [Planctomycetes bacterium GWF2_39_10]
MIFGLKFLSIITLFCLTCPVFKYYKLYIDFDIIKPCLLEVNKKLKNINGSSAFSVGTPIGFPSLDGRG